MIYIITDTHFNHSAMIPYCGRPENFNELIWRGLDQLKDDDILIHLGDICIGGDKEVHERLSKYKFRKILVRGNHDKKSEGWYMSHGWDFACEQFEMKVFGRRIMFSHKPVVWNGEYDINVHGHFHNADPDRLELELSRIKNGYQKLLAIEWTKYKPVSLEKFI